MENSFISAKKISDTPLQALHDHYRLLMNHHQALMDHHSLVQKRYHVTLPSFSSVDREHTMKAFNQALQDHHQLMAKTPS